MTIELKPNELFFLAKAMKAKYLDYAYLSMMQDIQLNYDVSEISNYESLVEKGYAEMDFGGDLEVDESVKNLMNPVFFGKNECLVKTSQKQVRVHQYESDLVFSEIDEDGMIVFSILDDYKLDELLSETIDMECANVDKGACSRSFSATELRDSNTRKEAISIMKGEW